MWRLGLVYNSWLRGRLSHTVTICLHCLLQEARLPLGERVLNADLAEDVHSEGMVSFLVYSVAPQ